MFHSVIAAKTDTCGGRGAASAARTPSIARSKEPSRPRIASWISAGPSMETTSSSSPAAAKGTANLGNNSPLVVTALRTPRALALRTTSTNGRHAVGSVNAKPRRAPG